MPLYDYECEGCHKIVERFEPFENREVQSECCPLYQAVRLVSASKLDVFREGRYEELGDDAPYITSKAHLADECRKRGLASKYLMDGYRSFRPKREI